MKAAALSQVIGAFLVVVGLGLWSPAVALVVAGVFLLVFGAVAEVQLKAKRAGRAG